MTTAEKHDVATENHDLLIRIDERLKALDDRVERIEKSFEEFRDYMYRQGIRNGWRERGITAAIASIIVAIAEFLRRMIVGA